MELTVQTSPTSTMNLPSEKKKTDCAVLPKGWQREEVLRRSGLSAGKVDVYYYSPTGKKIRSKPQLARYLGDTVDLSTFDFQQGQISSLLLCKNKKPKGTQFDYSRGVRSDASLVPPIRQTASIFKQPVTVYKTQDSKVKPEFKYGAQDKPKQLFWEKRLEGLNASDPWGVTGSASLPGRIKPLGPYFDKSTIIHSLATALHTPGQAILGQTGQKSAIKENPGVYLNPEQPLIQSLVISDEDILKQEERVNKARKRLQEALTAS